MVSKKKMKSTLCKSCHDSFLNHCTGGNNDILSLFLIKYNLDEMIMFMKILYEILIHNYDTEFDQQLTIENFYFNENDKEYDLSEYINININRIKEIDNQNTSYFILKSLFIIAFVKNLRIRLFILADHSYLKLLNTFPPTYNGIGDFIHKCDGFINDYQNPNLAYSFQDIGYSASIAWITDGLYWFK